MTDTNFYKATQLAEQSTTSSSFVDIPSTSITFSPNSTNEIWMIFATGVCRSSSTSERSFELRLVINGNEEDLISHQNRSSRTPNGAGFLVFDRITGTTSSQNVKLQYRALNGTCYATTLRVVAAKLPDNADFRYFESNSIVGSTGYNINIGSLTFTPSSSGNYYILGSVKFREMPSGNTAQVWIEGTDGVKHPNSPSNTGHSNARDPWNPASYVWRETLNTSSKTVTIRMISSNSGNEASEHCYRKIMIFREDAFDDADYSLSAPQSTTTSTNFQLKNSITTQSPPTERDYLVIQNMRISGTDSSGSRRKSGEIRIANNTIIRTNHLMNRDGSNTQGYHHTASLVDVRSESTSIKYDNGFLSPNSSTTQCAESAIVVLRYPSSSTTQTHQMIL